jgi:hypothetical protein
MPEVGPCATTSGERSSSKLKLSGRTCLWKSEVNGNWRTKGRRSQGARRRQGRPRKPRQAPSSWIFGVIMQMRCNAYLAMPLLRSTSVFPTGNGGVEHTSTRHCPLRVRSKRECLPPGLGLTVSGKCSAARRTSGTFAGSRLAATWPRQWTALLRD